MTDYATGSAGAREDFCRYLAACYYEPSIDFAEERLFDSMLAAAGAIDPELAECTRALGEAFFAESLQSLLVDYTALFIGPSQPRAMPYASFWLTDDQSLRHETTMAVLDFYEQGGLDVSDEFRELPTMSRWNSSSSTCWPARKTRQATPAIRPSFPGSLPCTAVSSSNTWGPGSGALPMPSGPAPGPPFTANSPGSRNASCAWKPNCCV
jgi:hypothetical protein